MSLSQKVYLFTDDLEIIPKKWNWSKVIKGTSLFGREFKLEGS